MAELLTQTGIPDPHNRMAQYAHELPVVCANERSSSHRRWRRGRDYSLPMNLHRAGRHRTKQVLNVFRVPADAGHGVLLITHDLSVVADIADRVVVMRQGSGERRCDRPHAPQHPLYPPSAGGHSS